MGGAPLALPVPQFETFVAEEIDKWAKVIKANGIKPE